MTGIFPTAYFGSIAYFQQLVRFDAIVIEAHDHFPKQTFRNRCTIQSPQGALRLTLPVEKPSGSKTPTAGVLVPASKDWRNNHWRAIQSAYASAPYFDHYSEEIRQLIYSDMSSLIAFNLGATQLLLQYFGLERAFSVTKVYHHSYSANDFRNVEFDSEYPEGFTVIPYIQVYFGHTDFAPNRSILDLLFCEGPLGRKQLML